VRSVVVSTIYLVRHGQTDWNRDLIYRGRTEIPLNETGIKQARCVGEAFAHEGVHGIYTSPLSRAARTAEVIGEALGVKPVADEGLLDIDYGRWSGKSLKEIRETFPEELERWIAHPEEFRFPGGESLEIVRRRIEGGIMRLSSEPHSKVIVVSHLAVLKVAVTALLDIGSRGFWRIRLDTGSISEFERADDGFVCNRLNDTSHLRALSLEKSIDF
jgi:broad specificity phosphatase PhoE